VTTCCARSIVRIDDRRNRSRIGGRNRDGSGDVADAIADVAAERGSELGRRYASKTASISSAE
jgi:hypothetical protein